MELLDSSVWNEQVKKRATKENPTGPKLKEISHSLTKVTKSNMSVR